MYDELKAQYYIPSQVYDQIKKDCTWWEEETIIRAIPDEAKEKSVTTEPIAVKNVNSAPVKST